MTVSVTKVGIATTFTTSGWTTVTWGVELRDDSNAWAAGSPTLITVPSGFTKGRASFQAAWTYLGVGGGARYIRISRNLFGGGTDILAGDIRPSVQQGLQHADTGWVTVTPGDAFFVMATSTSAYVDLAGESDPAGSAARSYFQAEFR
jgi:hypothetical protein